MRRAPGTGSLKRRKGVFWLRYPHGGERIEESSGIRATCACGGCEERYPSDDPNHAKAIRALRAKTKVTDTPAFVAPSAAKVTFEDLCALLKADYARKG